MRLRIAAVLAVISVVVCSGVPAGQEAPTSAPAGGPTVELTKHFEKVLAAKAGKADKGWYHREADLSELAGGWIDMITLCTTRPNGAPYPAGQLNMYVDNIKLTWPAER